MFSKVSFNRTLGTLLVADLVLLALSGLPAFKHADNGWKHLVGGVAWFGFVVVSVSLIGLAAVTVWRRRRSDNDTVRTGTAAAVTVDRGRKTALLGPVLLIAAMLADFAETVIDPASSGEAADVANAGLHHHGQMVLCGYLLLASAVFIFPGVFLLTRGLRQRGRRLRSVAVGFGFLGALGHTALATAYLVWAAMPAKGADQAQAVAMLERMMSSASLAPLAIGFIAFPFAIVTTLGALVRARVAPKWLLIPVIAAPLSAIVAFGGDVAATSTALTLLISSTAVVAVRVARGTPSATGAVESYRRQVSTGTVAVTTS